MSQKLSDGLKGAILNAFDSVDHNDTGQLNMKGVREVLQLIGQNPTKFEMEEYFDDDNQTIDRNHIEEFIEENVPLKSQTKIDEDIAEAFAKFATFDNNEKTEISKAEFMEILTKLGDEPLTDSEADMIIDSMGKRGHETLDVSDLSKLLRG